MSRFTRRDVLIGSLALATVPAALSATSAQAEEVAVNMLNRGSDGAPMVYEPALIQVAAGDVVKFVPTDKSHNAESIAGGIPEGAEPFKGKINEEIDVTFSVPGVYAVRCLPHYAMGMVALVVVDGDLSNLDAVMALRHPPKAKERFEALVAELEAGAAA